MLLTLSNITLSPLPTYLCTPSSARWAQSHQNLIFSIKIFPFQWETAEELLSAWLSQQCNTVNNVESDSSVTVVRIFIDCAGKDKVEEELRTQKTTSMLTLRAVGVFCSQLQGEVQSVHLGQCLAGLGWARDLALLLCHIAASSEPFCLSGSLLYLSSKINCNQIFLPASKIRRVKPGMSAKKLVSCFFGCLFSNTQLGRNFSSLP